MDRRITEEDIRYCREALQKAKVPYPVHIVYRDDFYTIHKDGTVDIVPLEDTLDDT